MSWKHKHEADLQRMDDLSHCSTLCGLDGKHSVYSSTAEVTSSVQWHSDLSVGGSGGEGVLEVYWT